MKWIEIGRGSRLLGVSYQLGYNTIDKGTPLVTIQLWWLVVWVRLPYRHVRSFESKHVYYGAVFGHGYYNLSLWRIQKQGITKTSAMKAVETFQRLIRDETKKPPPC